MDSLKLRWDWLCDTLLVSRCEERAFWWKKLLGLYSEKHRAYHTAEHLAEMFRYFQQWEGRIADRPAVAAAIFFHDAIYDPRHGSPRNEVDSADLFDEFGQACLPAGTPPGLFKGKFIGKVRRWILQTAHHRCGPDDDDDCRLFMDFDMAVLARPWPQYRSYSSEVRREYIHVSDALFCTARRGFLEGILAGNHAIFASEPFRGREELARENLRRESEELQLQLQTCSTVSRVTSRMALRVKALLPVLPRFIPPCLAVAAAAVAATASLRVILAALVSLTASILLTIVLLQCCYGGRCLRHPYTASSRSQSSQGNAVLAGSFNPPHLGHLEMLRYLASQHARIFVVIGINPNKSYPVTPYVRQELLRSMLRHSGILNVEVVVWPHYVWRYAQKVNARVMYRGIRSWREDGAAEKCLELQNFIGQTLYFCRPIPTAYLMAAPGLAHLSSTLLRKRISQGASIDALVPANCATIIQHAYTHTDTACGSGRSDDISVDKSTGFKL